MIRRSQEDLLGVRVLLFVAALFVVAGTLEPLGASQPAVQLPKGVKAVWDLEKAYREKTPTRGRVCLNGLWRWQPGGRVTEAVPDDGWGYFKVPGSWPGITNYILKDSQTVYIHPKWKDEKLGSITTAWYQREITIPGEWAGRRIAILAEYLNSYASVYVDGRNETRYRIPLET